jgi:hypothetical protein
VSTAFRVAGTRENVAFQSLPELHLDRSRHRVRLELMGLCDGGTTRAGFQYGAGTMHPRVPQVRLGRSKGARFSVQRIVNNRPEFVILGTISPVKKLDNFDLVFGVQWAKNLG